MASSALVSAVFDSECRAPDATLYFGVIGALLSFYAFASGAAVLVAVMCRSSRQGVVLAVISSCCGILFVIACASVGMLFPTAYAPCSPWSPLVPVPLGLLLLWFHVFFLACQTAYFVAALSTHPVPLETVV